MFQQRSMSCYSCLLYLHGTLQDFQCMFDHFASLYMKMLKVQIKLRSHLSSKK